MTRRGAGLVEYIGIVAVMAGMFAALVALRPQEVPRRAPVRAVPPLVRLLGDTSALLKPPAAPRAAPSRPRPSRPRRPRSARAPLVLDLPEWLAR